MGNITSLTFMIEFNLELRKSMKKWKNIYDKVR